MIYKTLLAFFIAAGISQADPSAALEAFAKERIAAGTAAGIVTEVGDKDRVLIRDAAGFADLDKQVPMKEDTIFWIASMSKPICGSAVMMEVENGSIALSDAVAKYLPEFETLKGPDGKLASITIEQCLSHTSGLQDLTKEEDAAMKDLEQLSKVTAAKPLIFQPGTEWKYCQTGICIAARILEVVSGKNYPDYLSEHLFVPLGMKDTTFYPTEAQLPRIATSYKLTDKGLSPVPVFILHGKSPVSTDHYPTAAGGLFSTAVDYGKFARMILNGGEIDGKHYLSPESIKQMTTSHTDGLKAGFVAGNAYGLGWIAVQEALGVTSPLSEGSFGHGGAYGTQAWIDPVRGRYTLLMIQRSDLGNGDGSETRALFQKAAAE
ncbi:serine hydrolase domain-containing protein [Luteolibacter algae]|uniref:Serine hydrolase domain-containing protein n=1 Tax=Luteolibacter algae TaxID=454151 RepID=A0ABW5D7G9_9BACT